MAADEGVGPDAVTHFQRLAASPEHHHIFFALRVIEAHYRDAPPLGASRRPREDKVRLSQEPELGFPPTTISSFQPAGARPGTLVNRFFGFFGPHGPLPLHLTEYARDRQLGHRDRTISAFLNMFTHRFMSLLYRAWVTGQPTVDADRGADTRMRRHVGALAGYGGRALQNRDAIPDLTKRRFTAFFGGGVAHPEGLEAMVTSFFGVPARVEEFVGQWLALEPADRTQLGGGGRLGRDAGIGSEVWSRAAKFRLHIGPMTLEDFERLLPGGVSFPRLAALVRGYAGDALDWDANLILNADEVPRARLGGTTRLGLTGWLGQRPSPTDADELMLSPLAAATPTKMAG